MGLSLWSFHAREGYTCVEHFWTPVPSDAATDELFVTIRSDVALALVDAGEFQEQSTP